MRGKEWKSNEWRRKEMWWKIYQKGKMDEEKNERDDKKGIMAKEAQKSTVKEKRKEKIKKTKKEKL